MDSIDIKLLSALEENSRISLKNLAKTLNVNTSTIYHRLHKLRESNILEKFTISINPEEVGLKVHALLSIRLKKMVIGKLDKMFIESFAKYLADQYTQCLFSATANDEQIWLICTFKEEKELTQFSLKLEENPYIEQCDVIKILNILKGKKLFKFDDKLISDEEDGDYFDDSLKEMNETGEDSETKFSDLYF